MNARPANQYEIEQLMRGGWRMQFDPTRRASWRLWAFPFVSREQRAAHGQSCRALLRARKFTQVAATTKGIAWYVWADQQTSAPVSGGALG